MLSVMELSTKTIPQTGSNHSATVIFFHGPDDTGSNLAEFVRFLLGGDLQFGHIKVIYPMVPLQSYTPLGGEAIEMLTKESRKSLEAIYKSVGRLIDSEVDSGIPLNRIIVGGFSMGGALAMHTAYHIWPELCGCFVLSSFLNNDSIVYETLETKSMDIRRAELLMMHGGYDPLVLPEQGRKTFDALQKLGVPGVFVPLEYTMHEVDATELHLLYDWIIKLLPDDERIAVRCIPYMPSAMELPVETIQPVGNKHSATVIFFHGPDDTGSNLAEFVRFLLGGDLQFEHIKVIYPTVPITSYSIIYERVGRLIDSEVDSGIPISRIIVGGFLMGGDLAIHTAYHMRPELRGCFALSSSLHDASIVYESLRAKSMYRRRAELLMMHREYDPMVLPEQGRKTFDALQKLGVSGQFVPLEYTMHELEANELYLLYDWIIKLLPDDKRFTARPREYMPSVMELPTQISSQMDNNKHNATVIFFHGPDDTADFMSYLCGEWLEFGHIKVIYPTVPLESYTPLGKELLDGKTTEASVKESRKSMAAIYESVGHLIDSEVKSGIPLNRIIVGGFSVGGALAIHAAYHIRPELRGCFTVSSFLNKDSIVYESLRTKSLRTKSWRRRRAAELLMIHGDLDSAVLPERGRETFDALQRLGVFGDFVSVKYGVHCIDSDEWFLLYEWICKILPDDKSDPSTNKLLWKFLNF